LATGIGVSKAGYGYSSFTACWYKESYNDYVSFFYIYNRSYHRMANGPGTDYAGRRSRSAMDESIDKLIVHPFRKFNARLIN